MRDLPRKFLCALLAGLVSTAAGQDVGETKLMICEDAACTRTQTIVEPYTVALDSLYSQADVVVEVLIESGDAELYQPTFDWNFSARYASARFSVYKGMVLQSFKGGDPGYPIFFGPFDGLRMGGQYLLFLKKSAQIPKPRGQKSPYGELAQYYRMTYQGFSAFPMERVCVFDGKTPAGRCDYAFGVDPQRIILPTSIKSYPEEILGQAGQLHWVRFKRLLDYVETLSKANRK